MSDTHPSRARGVVKATKSLSATTKQERPAPCNFYQHNERETDTMRDNAVPCVNATQFETHQGKHLTWEDDRVCTRCKRTLDLFAQRRAIASSYEEQEREPVV